MTPDNLLPIWPFLPNWRDGVNERLSWATIVMSSESGAEQRQGSRLSPRREFEATFNPVGDVRTYFDLFLSTLGGQDMMIPLWHDKHRTTSATVVGATRINCATEYGEFMDDGMALLVGRDPWSHRAVQIDTVDATGFSLKVATDFAWPDKAVVLPLRRARIALDSGLQGLTSRVGESQMRFTLNQANDIPALGAWDGFEYQGLPVVTRETNWSAPVDVSFTRITEQEDNGTGLVYLRDLAERAFRSKTHTWHIRGRADNWAWRQFLYRLAGRRTPVWMPSGNQDMTVSATAAANANRVNIGRVGFDYLGGPQPGRERFLVRTPEGYQVRTITALSAPPTPSIERLNITPNLTWAIPAGTKLQFLEIMRADGDDIEIMHHTDVEGMSECSINFRGFSNTRDASGPNVLSYPVGLMTNSPCGVPDSPCSPVYNEWALRVVARLLDNPPEYANVYNAFNPQTWTGPNGRSRLKGENVYYGFLTDDLAYPCPTGGTMRIMRDFNNPDGSPGGPLIGFQYPDRSMYQWFFYGTLSSNPADRFFQWNHQFTTIGAGGIGKNMMIYVYDANDTLLAQKPAVYGDLYPYGYNVDY